MSIPLHCNRHTKRSSTFSQSGRHPKRESGYGKVNADLAFLMVSSARGHTYHSPPVQVALPFKLDLLQCKDGYVANLSGSSAFTVFDWLRENSLVRTLSICKWITATFLFRRKT